MNIAEEKMVSVVYELKYDDTDAQLIEKVEKDNPLTFLYGKGRMLEHFEKNLAGLAVGDSFDFKLTAEEAYGPVTEQAIVDVPMEAFEVDGKVDEKLIAVGNTIPMMDSYGNRLHGIVVESNESIVKMDFNHPLAGEDLHFKGKVIEVRDPKPEELAESCGTGCSTDGCGSGGCCGGC
ncbi:MAG TPA: peptidylprolyl isomerase [Marinilabiliales bacterium]|jgi:FKBP-type peptidyl-prolyl cis-trans isomerase SlyD|nr:FKBP-type peptidyl-prolyl cis-trans isomerase [Salinivirgaceae bacterium]OFX41884.1 MAG: peptidylprolyl isomerase [Bacteroidetes bacterium GWA2_40_14]OFX56838.1 MAG: peptidylprolyl isomerase [Bacteroidetes bacterium GWC2_40_13]OFX76050.1 MAG: peptidylprolyl isomerase [Bacteroidetes bacterium GWD2_40_43]OFX94336.1 MAG: peptidylprolyl isomerase [Bacteroidetes bacterium GWE2_40_63]OFY18813.1 MAG: peptidylprolyl isomerase [Bacteroidetes bacterium GWF2_40_13]OFZ24789.1 MAG: peptidylprolyl isome